MASIPFCTKLHSAGSSDKRRMHRCLGIGSSGAPDLKSFQGAALRPARGLAMPIFSFSLSSLEPKSLRMVILTIMLVQVLCCHSITKITQNGINGGMFVTHASQPYTVFASVCLAKSRNNTAGFHVSSVPCARLDPTHVLGRRWK